VELKESGSKPHGWLHKPYTFSFVVKNPTIILKHHSYARATRKVIDNASMYTMFKLIVIMRSFMQVRGLIQVQ
jgi:hypothetical protein